jgi:hypothetical protein
MREKITLVQAAGWKSDFHQFNLNITQFPTVFRWLELPTSTPSVKAPNANGTAPPKSKVAQKKPNLDAPSGPRQNEAWSNGAASAKSSVFGADRSSSGATNNYDNANNKNFGKKTTSSLTSSQQSAKQPCRFFQKVR